LANGPIPVVATSGRGDASTNDDSASYCRPKSPAPMPMNVMHVRGVRVGAFHATVLMPMGVRLAHRGRGASHLHDHRPGAALCRADDYWVIWSDMRMCMRRWLGFWAKNTWAQAAQPSYADTSPAIEKPCKDCRMNCAQQNLRSRRRREAKQCCPGESVENCAAVHRAKLLPREHSARD